MGELEGSPTPEGSPELRPPQRMSSPLPQAELRPPKRQRSASTHSQRPRRVRLPVKHLKPNDNSDGLAHLAHA